MLDDLGSSLQRTMNKIRGKTGVLREDDIEPIVKDIQRALLDADVDVNIVQTISENIRERTLDTEPPEGITAREHVLNVVYEEMKSIIGASTEIPLEQQDILLLGVQGAGKTTSSAKIGWWFDRKGLRTGIIQTDTQRPGAHRQTQQLADDADIPYSVDPDEPDAVQRLKHGLDDLDHCDVRIVDTAGRHSSEDELINELQALDEELNPDLKILVLDAGTGKSAENQVERFSETIGIDGVFITKMDGSAKGGGALTAVNKQDTTISFIGTGETVEDIERFDEDGFISQLLGMGDLEKLSERVEQATEEVRDWSPEDALEGEFTLYDMQKQLETFNNMGNIKSVLNKIPGGFMSQIDDSFIEQQEETIEKYSIIMDSMTEEELQTPSMIGESRKQRIARGSGTSIEDVEQLLSQYHGMRNVMDNIDGADELQQMGGGGNPLSDLLR